MVRVLLKLLLLNALAACGAPGSDSVFTQRTAKGKSTDSATTKVVAPPSAPSFAVKAHRGYFRRYGDEFQFQPCGTRTPLAIFGPAQARAALKERARFSDVWEGTRQFGVFLGAIVTDTPSVQADSGKPVPRTRFFIAGVDSLRGWRSSDCGGMQLP